jgi:hypothetical protein
MKRKQTTTNGVGHQDTRLRPAVQADFVDQERCGRGTLGLMSSATYDSRIGELPVAVSSKWIAWWLNLPIN